MSQKQLLKLKKLLLWGQSKLTKKQFIFLSIVLVGILSENSLTNINPSISSFLKNLNLSYFFLKNTFVSTAIHNF